MKYQVTETVESIGELRIKLECISNLDSAIDEMFRELEARGSANLLEELCPYFGTVWPSARTLARWILEQGRTVFESRRVLELGCGLALPSFAAAHLGAEVTASDAHPDVEEFFKRNLARNSNAKIQFRRLDWRVPAPQAISYDWIIGSDVLYEKYQAAALVDFLKTALAPKGQAVFLDPKRAYWERLVIFGRHAGFHVATHSPRIMSETDPREAVLLHLYRSKY